MKTGRILLFTDFTYSGPYVGEMHLAVAGANRSERYFPVYDLMHDAPRGNPKASAYLLGALSTRFQKGDICVGVVDPGVGGDRTPMIVKADGVWFVGPNNGLFEIVCRRAKDVQIFSITWSPPSLSASFHGRDLFAPVAAQLAAGSPPPGADITDLRAEGGRPGADWPNQLAEIIYIDGFGNAVTGISAPVAAGTTFSIGGQPVTAARTFSDVNRDEPLWYANSMGLIEFAVNQNDASSVLGLYIGMAIDRHSPKKL